MQLAKDPSRPRVAFCATCALAYIGKSALPSLLDLLTNQQPSLRITAISELSRLGTNARPAIPVLLASLKDVDSRVREVAAETVGQLALEPSITLPALADCMQDMNYRLRYKVVQAFGRFGIEAQPFVACLDRAVGDPEESVRWIATNSLRKIAEGSPETDRLDQFDQK